MSTNPTPGSSYLGLSRSDRVWTYGLFGGGGMLLLLLAPALSSWLASVPIVPFKGPLEWVASFDQPWAWVARPVVGLIGGLVLAVVTIADSRSLIVAHDTVTIVHDRDRRTLRRDQIVGVHVDGKKITLDGDHGRVLFDHQVDAKRDDVRAAFVDRGYPWESN